MPADSTIVQTTTNNVVDSSSDLHGLLSLVVGWWWVIILLAITVLIGYTKKKWVVKFYRRVFIKFLIKMDKFIIIYNQWDILYSKGLYEQLINECNEADNNSEILEEEKEKINNYREKAETAKKSREISVLLNDVDIKIDGGFLNDSKGLIEKVKALLCTYNAKDKKSFSEKIIVLENKIKTKKIEKLETTVQEAIDKKEYGSLIQALSTKSLTNEGLSKKEISPVMGLVKNACQTLTNSYLKEGKINDAITLVNYCFQLDTLKDDEFVSELKESIVKEIKLLISEKINKYLPTEAKSIRDRYNEFLPNSVLREINKKIEICEDSKPAKIKDYLGKAIEAAKKGLFVDAWEVYEKAKKLQGEDITEIKNKIILLENENKDRLNKKRYNELIENIKTAIKKQNEVLALGYIEQAKLMDVDDKSELNSLSAEISKMQKANEDEKKFFSKKSILLAKCDGKEYFNVPKKENHGEDSDPYVNVDPNRIWGVISVFDGMGGAGARKYKHIISGEEHTSAWWASRYVKEAIENLISSRPKGENPISYIEKNIKSTIILKLNEVVKNFPAANAPLLSKMMRKLPTTMALCMYFIEEDNITINCYWSGDSRIYMFDKDKMYFLTKDDADAFDGDPFSPANMDLAMNNTICQDRDFKINKSTIKVPYGPDNPIVLIAATDGCFGYFKNPIEFEYTIRHCLSTSNNLDDYLPSIKNAIIDNIQQDDFSMALVQIGVEDFTQFKEKLTLCLHNVLFNEYYIWKRSSKQSQDAILSKISEIEDKILYYKNNIDESRQKIKKIEEDIEKSAFLSEYEGYDNFKQKLLSKRVCVDQKLSDFLNCMEKLSNERNSLKETLDSIQLRAESQNNDWYAKYKEFFEIVNPVETVE